MWKEAKLPPSLPSCSPGFDAPTLLGSLPTRGARALLSRPRRGRALESEGFSLSRAELCGVRGALSHPWLLTSRTSRGLPLPRAAPRSKETLLLKIGLFFFFLQVESA